MGASKNTLRGVVVGTTVALLLSAFASSAAAANGGSASNSVLGAKKPPKGEPVKVGFIYGGRGPTVDSTFQKTTTDELMEFLNQRGGGFAGHPIELVTCVSGFSDPGKANTCANEMVAAGVAIVVMPDTTSALAVHEVLDAAKIPLFLNTGAEPALRLSDTTFILTQTTAATTALPIAIAKANKIKQVTPVVIDVPAATAVYTSDPGPGPFKKAGIKLDLVPLPPGQADMTPQMIQIANGDPTVVQLVGNDAFCIPALKGLQAAGFKGPIGMIALCVTDSLKQAVGSYLKGVSIAAFYPVGDTKNAGYKQLKAIDAAYGGGLDDLDKAMPMYIEWMAVIQAVQNLEGAVTPATVTAAIKAMPNTQIPGANMWYRCNGKAISASPANCMNGTLRSELDAKGIPTLPFVPSGNTKVPD